MQITGKETELSRISSHWRHFALLQNRTLAELAGQKRAKKEEKKDAKVKGQPLCGHKRASIP